MCAWAAFFDWFFMRSGDEECTLGNQSGVLGLHLLSAAKSFVGCQNSQNKLRSPTHVPCQ